MDVRADAVPLSRGVQISDTTPLALVSAKKSQSAYKTLNIPIWKDVREDPKIPANILQMSMASILLESAHPSRNKDRMIYVARNTGRYEYMNIQKAYMSRSTRLLYQKPKGWVSYDNNNGKC